MSKQSFVTGQVLTAAQLTNLQQTAMLGGDAVTKTASYVLVAADAGSTVAMTSTSATTITVNTGLFAAGDTVFIQNRGSGNLTVTAGSATVATAGSLILPQNDAGILYFTATGASIFYDFIQVGAVSPLTTKGDLYTFGTSDTRLAVGATNGMVLTVDSSEATGLKFATPAGGGKVLQVVNALLSTTAASTSSSYADTGLTASITPSLDTSKVLVLVNVVGLQGAGASTYGSLRLVKDSTALITFEDRFGFIDGANNSNHIGGSGCNYLDSPATISATTYKIQFLRGAGAGTVRVSNDAVSSTITLLEIGA